MRKYHILCWLRAKEMRGYEIRFSFVSRIVRVAENVVQRKPLFHIYPYVSLCLTVFFRLLNTRPAQKTGR